MNHTQDVVNARNTARRRIFTPSPRAALQRWKSERQGESHPTAYTTQPKKTRAHSRTETTDRNIHYTRRPTKRSPCTSSPNCGNAPSEALAVKMPCPLGTPHKRPSSARRRGRSWRAAASRFGFSSESRHRCSFNRPFFCGADRPTRGHRHISKLCHFCLPACLPALGMQETGRLLVGTTF